MIQKEMREKREPLFYSHSQSLTDGSRSLWPAGRAWFSMREGITINPEWHFGPNVRCLDLSFDFASEEDDLSFHIAIPFLLTFYLTLSRVPILHSLFRKIRGGFGYKTAIEIRWDSIWIDIFRNEIWGAHRVVRWLPHWLSIYVMDESGFGLNFSFHFWDMIFGRPKYSEELIGSPIDLPIAIAPDTTLLEREYIGRVQMKRASWKRSRWPFPREILRADIECLTPIPTPGKGENSWDQDDDATFSFLTPADTPELGILNLVHSIERRRKEYGLPDEIARLARGVYGV